MNPILNHVRKLQQKFDDIAQEMQALIRSLDLLRQGASDDSTVDGSGHLPSPNVIAQEMQPMNRSPDLIRRGTMDDTTVDGSGYLPSPNVIAQEMRPMNHSPDFIRQGTIDNTRMNGSEYPSWLTDMTPTYTTANCAGPPIGNALYAINSHLRSAQDNAPSNEWLASRSTISSDVDIPTAMNNITSFYRNGSKRYRCQCGSETERIADMKRHLKSRSHLSPQFACICGRMFTRKDGRKSHQKRCHRIEAQDAFLNL